MASETKKMSSTTSESTAGGGQEDVSATEVDKVLQAVDGVLLLSDTRGDDLLDLPTASEDGAVVRKMVLESITLF